MGFMTNLLAKEPPFSRLRPTDASHAPESTVTLLLTERWQ
jgi:hypothetical protein